MPTGYPMLVVTNDGATEATLQVRVPRPQTDDSAEADSRLTVLTLVVEPGHTSSDHVQPGPTSAGPRYIGTPAVLMATAACFVVAALFSQR